MNVNEYKCASYWQNKRMIDEKENLDLAIIKFFGLTFLAGVGVSAMLWVGCFLDFIIY